MSGRWFRFSYHILPRADREPMPHQTRDGDAALWLAPVLAERGFVYEELLLNYPAWSHAQERVLDEGFLRSGDLLVVTTRPPIHDRTAPTGKGVPAAEHRGSRVDRRLSRSCTNIERRVFDVVSRYFDWCARSHMVLSAEVVTRFPALARRRSMSFQKYLGAAYEAYSEEVVGPSCKPPGEPRKTPAFLIYEREAWPGGPGVLAAFGVGGTQTLMWARFLCKRYPHLVCREPFVMADIEADLPAGALDDLRFSDRFQVEILAPAPVDEPPADEPPRPVPRRRS